MQYEDDEELNVEMLAETVDLKTEVAKTKRALNPISLLKVLRSLETSATDDNEKLDKDPEDSFDSK